ncbi:hypothetical protein ABNX05_04885 [Lysinibacillus sp. M3]|uniref:Phage gp6-like head-tail connector protein n=1 Tax=Lysinibacillus zambalensis TaxID=3160866 RepID=A0ABV1MRR2_9BACI
MNEITEELLAEFKERMKLSDDEDGNLTRILKASTEDLIDKCGDYDVHVNERFKELVFERSRYAYNDAIEYFDNNFLTQITTLAISKALSSSSSVEGDTSEKE